MYVFCLLLLLLPVAQQQRAHDPLDKKNNTQKPNAERQNKETGSSENGFSGNYQIQEPQKKSEQEQKADDFDKGFQRVYWGATILGVLISLGLLCALIHQNKLTRITAEAAKRSAKAANLNSRAAINAERAWIFCKAVKHGTEHFKLSFANHGRTPGEIVVIQVFPRVRPRDEELPVPPSYGLDVRFEQIRVLGASEPWEFPDYTLTVSNDFGPEMTSDIKSNKLRYVVYGIVKYKDVFRPDIHHSGFCYTYNPFLDELLPYGPTEYTTFS